MRPAPTRPRVSFSDIMVPSHSDRPQVFPIPDRALFGTAHPRKDVLLDQELPYSMAVDVLRYDESGRKAVKIGANLLVERDSQKRIVVGKGGAMIKKIGIRARQAIEDWVGRQVHLELFVKVDPGWLKNERRIKELGYF